MYKDIRAVVFENNQLEIIDQSLLPGEEKRTVLGSVSDVYEAIRSLKVRGAPAIAIAAAYGLYIGLRQTAADNVPDFWKEFIEAKTLLASARPTAINLFTALDRQERRLLNTINDLSLGLGLRLNTSDNDTQNSAKRSDVPYNTSGSCPHIGLLLSALLDEAEKIRIEEEDASLRMGEYGLSLLKPGMGLLTHCNAGALASAGYGTALSPVYLGQERDYGFKVFADETRPLLQGARLTAWELMKAGIDVTLICDNMASAAMRKGWVQAVLTGCDRMAANGDGANKIGTSALAILAKAYNIPFYMFVPTSTIDIGTDSGDAIPIELREGDEICKLWFEKPVAPEGVKTWNPAFDVTKHEYISAIITEKGIIYPPFSSSIKHLCLE